MCKQQKFVYNKYIHHSVFVSCGHCDACLQQKANSRASKIRNQMAIGDLCLFVTLTYDNKFVPYLKKSDLVFLRDLDTSSLPSVSLPVYRDYEITRNDSFVKSDSSLCHVDFSDVPKENLFFLPYLRRKRDCVGVILYDDVKRFMKRLRINLKRKLNYQKSVSYYAVAEYGGTYHRPHFHLLLFFPEGTLETLRPIIATSWPYGDMLRSDKRIQQAVNASSYVASYVNKSVNLPKILQTSSVRQKHSHSLHFGVSLQQFSLPSILEKVSRGDCSYTCQVLKDGVPVLVNLPLPKYVVNRYFPKFKGYFSFSDDEIRQLLLHPINLWNCLGEKKFVYLLNNDGSLVSIYDPHWKYLGSYSSDDYHRFVVHLLNCYEYYHKVTGKNMFDYAIDFVSVWRCRASYILKHSYDDVVDFSQFYYNYNEFVMKPKIAPTLSIFEGRLVSPNFYLSNIRKDSYLVTLKNQIDVIRNTNGRILSELYDDM